MKKYINYNISQEETSYEKTIFRKTSKQKFYVGPNISGNAASFGIAGRSTESWIELINEWNLKRDRTNARRR